MYQRKEDLAAVAAILPNANPMTVDVPTQWEFENYKHFKRY